MSFQKLVSIAEDGPWCGTVPRKPWPHSESLVFGPHPEPWRLNDGPRPEPWEIAGRQAGLYAAIRMFQFGQQLKVETAELMTSVAGRFFDEWCGTVPLSILIYWLLHWPPPPPPPWLERVSYLANTVILAEVGEQQQLAAVANRQLVATLRVRPESS